MATTGNAWSTSSLYAALDLYLHIQELVVTEGHGRAPLLAAAREVYAPTLCVIGPWAQASIREGKEGAGDRARAFVCKGPTCSPPVTTPGELAKLLSSTG